MSENSEQPVKGYSLKFDASLNLGHILVFMGMIGSVVSVYVSFMVSDSKTDLRLNSIERIVTEQTEINRTMLNLLNELRISTAVSKERIDRLERTIK